MCFDGEYPDISRVKHVIARKPNTCTECRGPILKGDWCQVASTLFEGHWANFRICMKCQFMAARIYAEEIALGCRPGESYPMLGDGTLAEDYREHVLNRKQAA